MSNVNVGFFIFHMKPLITSIICHISYLQLHICSLHCHRYCWNGNLFLSVPSVSLYALLKLVSWVYGARWCMVMLAHFIEHFIVSPSPSPSWLDNTFKRLGFKRSARVLTIPKYERDFDLTLSCRNYISTTTLHCHCQCFSIRAGARVSADVGV